MFNLKVIVTSKQWTSALYHFFNAWLRNKGDKTVSGPIIAVANFLEASLYGDIDIRPKLVAKRAEKLEIFDGILKSERENGRILVFCKSKESCDMITNHIGDKEAMVLHEELDNYQISEALQKIFEDTIK